MQVTLKLKEKAVIACCLSVFQNMTYYINLLGWREFPEQDFALFFSQVYVTYSSLFQAIFIFFLVKYKPLKYNNVYTYPDWGYGIGWMMALSSMVCIPLWICVKLWKSEGTILEVMFIFIIKQFDIVDEQF